VQCVRSELELLDAFSGIDLGGINVTELVDRHGMHPVELAGVAAIMPEAADHAAVVALEDADFIVLAVRRQKLGLLRVRPERDVPHRLVAECIPFVKPFRHEGAVLLEDLDAVVDAVADIDQAVIGDPHATHGITELLCDPAPWGRRALACWPNSKAVPSNASAVAT
jgi:hypothetical protein